MAQYRKRRIAHGPNKNEEKVRRAQEAGRQAGVLKERFPTVGRLALRFTITNPVSGESETEERAFNPGDPCELTLACPGRCGVGKFDVTEMVQTAVDAHQASADASAACPEVLFAGLPDTCGHKLDCHLDVTFLA